MAKNKTYSVIIDGEEFVSKAAKDAGDGMDKLAKKKDGWIKSFVDVKAAWDTVIQAARMLYSVANDSLAAFDEYEASMRRLEGTAKITGTPLGELTELAKHAKREFGLSSVQANDYATAVNNMAMKSGYAGDKQELLARVLDLGAAKGLNAAETLVALEQSILGVDEGTDKLFGKNPSALWAEYAEQIGKSPGKMSDMEKSLVLVYATLKEGGKVQGSFGDWLESSQGQQARLTNRLQEGKVAFGELLQPVRDVVTKGINTFISSLGDGKEGLEKLKTALTLVAQNVVGTFLTAWQSFGPAVVVALKVAVGGLMLFSDAAQMLQIVVQESLGWIARRLGSFAEKTASLMQKLGFDVTAEWGTSLRKWGEVADAQASATYTKFRERSEAAWDSVTSDAQGGGKAVKDALNDVGDTSDDQMGRVADGAAKAGAAMEQHLGGSVRDMIGITKGALRELGDVASATMDPTQAQAFNRAMQQGVEEADAVSARLLRWSPAVADAKGKAAGMVNDVAGIARTALDAAQAFGLMNTEAASLLTSVLNVGQSIGKVLTGDLSGIGGVVAGVANIAKQITGGDTERKKLIRENTLNLARLTKEVNGLRLGVTGEEYSGVQGALDAIRGSLQKGFVFDVGGTDALRKQLFERGVDFTDLDNLAKAMGYDIRTQSGALSGELLGIFLQALDRTGPTMVGGGFDAQLEQMLTGFDVRGTSGMAQLSSLFGLATRSGASALNGLFDPSDIGGTRAGLLDLFDRFESGGVSPSEIGGLTGAQFRDFIVDLIGRIDAMADAAPASPPSAPPGTDDPIVPGVPTTPVLTLADVFTAYGDRTVPLFTDQLTAQLRIADATEATAVNTALTAEEVRALRIAIEGGALVSYMDNALADRRLSAEANAGRGPRV